MLAQWSSSIGMCINTDKTVYQYFTCKRVTSTPSLVLNTQPILYKKVMKHLGLCFDAPRLTFKEHVQYLVDDCSKRMRLLKCLCSQSWGANRTCLLQFYKAFIRAKMDYGSQIYASAAKTRLKKLDTIQNTCLRIILGAMPSTRIEALQCEASILPLSLHREKLICHRYYQILYSPPKHPIVRDLLPQLAQLHDYLFSNIRPRPFLLRARSLLQWHSLPTSISHHLPFLSSIPPWDDNVIQSSTTLILPISKTTPLPLQRVAFLSTLDINYPQSIPVYTDGSLLRQQPFNSVCAAFTIPSFSVSQHFKLRDLLSIFEAEAFAILKS